MPANTSSRVPSPRSTMTCLGRAKREKVAVLPSLRVVVAVVWSRSLQRGMGCGPFGLAVVGHRDVQGLDWRRGVEPVGGRCHQVRGGDRKSTRLNSSHVKNSYAVFCLKKK